MPAEAEASLPSERFPGARSAPVLTLAGIAALLSSACCVMPLVFAIVGISGAWIGQLRLLAPFSVPLSVLAVGALAFAGYTLYRPSARACDIEGSADCRTVSKAARRWFWLVVVLTLVPLVVPLAAPLFY
jgi:mercuric ion transport protein